MSGQGKVLMRCARILKLRLPKYPTESAEFLNDLQELSSHIFSLKNVDESVASQYRSLQHLVTKLLSKNSSIGRTSSPTPPPRNRVSLSIRCLINLSLPIKIHLNKLLERLMKRSFSLRQFCQRISWYLVHGRHMVQRRVSHWSTIGIDLCRKTCIAVHEWSIVRIPCSDHDRTDGQESNRLATLCIASRYASRRCY